MKLSSSIKVYYGGSDVLVTGVASQDGKNIEFTTEELEDIIVQYNSFKSQTISKPRYHQKIENNSEELHRDTVMVKNLLRKIRINTQ
jgi:hypothetical protein